MKKFIPLFFLIFLVISCQKNPDISQLDEDFVVFTDYDKDANFSSYSTYYIPDSILVIGKEKQARYFTDDQTKKVIAAFETEMNDRGYSRVTQKSAADMGIQVSYVEDVNYLYGYHDYPYWWWGYPGYWWPGYWGGWNDWYYPYPIVYSYKVGSLITEIVDLKAENPKAGKSQLAILWTAYITGLLSSSNQYNTQLTLSAVEQAFAQSQYIKK